MNCIKKFNDELLDFIYNKESEIIEPYSMKLDNKKTRYVCTREPDKKLFINKTDKRFIACDGMVLHVDGNSVDDNTIKNSRNGKYGTILISGLFDVINNIPISYHQTTSNNQDGNEKNKA